MKHPGHPIEEVMPLRDGSPTLHEMIVAEMMAKDPVFLEAYVSYLEAEWPVDEDTIVLDFTDE